jgi:hypothetical protein
MDPVLVVIRTDMFLDLIARTHTFSARRRCFTRENLTASLAKNIMTHITNDLIAAAIPFGDHRCIYQYVIAIGKIIVPQSNLNFTIVPKLKLDAFSSSIKLDNNESMRKFILALLLLMGATRIECMQVI